LRLLQHLKAIHSHVYPGDQKTYYSAETSMRTLAASLINERLRPALQANAEQLDQIEALIAGAGEKPHSRPDEEPEASARNPGISGLTSTKPQQLKSGHRKQDHVVTATLRSRLQSLRTWNRSIQKLIPLAQGLIGRKK
jgi:hypothetical protein